MRWIVAAALALGACSSHAQERDGERAERDFPVGTFDRVTLAGSHDVIVHVGGAPSVRAEGDPEALDRLDVRVENGELRIGSRGHSGWSWSGRRRGVTVHVTAPSLAGASVTGSGDMRIDRAEAQSFTGTVAGSGDLSIATVRASQARFAITGSGSLRAAGSAGEAQVEVTGSGDADLREFESEAAEVRLRGSGDARLRATRTAAISLLGSGDVTVAGGARCSITKRGSGDVRCS